MSEPYRYHRLAAVASAGLAALLLAAVPAPVRAEGAGLHDPFMPPGWNEPRARVQDFNTSAWTLESTLVSNGRRVAIINGEAVRPGDRVAGAQVLEVGADHVQLRHGQQRFTIERSTTQVRTSRDEAQ